MHGCAPRPSLPEHTDVEVAAAVEAVAGAGVDRAAFMATRRWCTQSLEEFGATERLLAMLASGGKEAMSSGSLRRSGIRNEGLNGLEES